MRDVAFDGGGEKNWLLRNEADLGAEPFQVKILEIDAVKFDIPRKRVVESFDERNDSRLPGTRCTDQSDGLSSAEGQ